MADETMNNNIPSLIIYTGTLLIQSPLFIGMGSAEGITGTAPLRTDGRGNPIIPGTALAGVFFEDLHPILEQMALNPRKHWLSLTGKFYEARDMDEGLPGRSALRFDSALLSEELLDMPVHDLIEVRDRIALDPVTRTASDEEGNKFSQQQLIVGCRFSFQLTIETEFFYSSKAGKLDDSTIQKVLDGIDGVLQHWTEDCFWLGNSSGAGNGWLQLEGLQKRAVQNEKDYRHFLENDILKVGEFPLKKDVQKSMAWKTLDFEIEINPKTQEDTWGLDFLSIQQGDQGRFLSPHDAPFYRGYFLENSENPSIQEHYVIPGSSMRGAMRAFLSNHYPKASIESWFGTAKSNNEKKSKNGGNPGKIRFRDAKGAVAQKSAEEWVVHAHAEDEFTASTYGSSLFDFSPLLTGVFKAQLSYTTHGLEESEAKQWEEALILFFQYASSKHVSLGHGGGHVAWQCPALKEVA